MINNDYSKWFGIKIKMDNKSQKSALEKLTEFNKSMENSDFKNSYTCFSIEIKLIDEAIAEMKTFQNKAKVDELTNRKQQIIKEHNTG